MINNTQHTKIVTTLTVVFVFLAMISLSMLFSSCKKEAESTGPQISATAIITGTITDGLTKQPVAGASVALVNAKLSSTKNTASDGRFSFTVDLTGITSLQSTIQVTGNAYLPADTAFLLEAGIAKIVNLVLDKDTSTVIGPGASGTTYTNTIAFLRTSTNQLSVRGVGGTETAVITYEARDSSGFPVDNNHQDTISVSLYGAPVAGNAYASPLKVVTNGSGRVAFTVNSGTVSGVLQIVAKMKRRSAVPDTIISQPVRLVVSGGLPSQANFSIGASKINVPGLLSNQNGATTTIGVILGDKFGNPVPEGTAIYFSTNIGIVNTHAGFTSSGGFAYAVLTAANPKGTNGIGYVKATTVGNGGATIQDSIKILFSGTPTIANFSKTNGGITPFTVTFNVYDAEFSNPLASGTTIQIATSGEGVAAASPSGGYKMPDVYSGYTSYTFTIDAIGSPRTPGPFTGTITVSGTNGTVITTFSGSVP